MSDAKLRGLERQYSQSPDKALLLQIDRERSRNGLHPHWATRLRVASERYGEYNYKCFMIVVNLEDSLDYIFEQSDEVRILSDEMNERQYIPEIRRILRLRSLTMDDCMGAIGGQPYRRDMLAFLKEEGLEPIEIGELPEGAFESGHMMPHTLRSGTTERWEVADRYRRGFDAECYDMLNSLSRLGILSASNMLTYYEDDEEVAEMLLNIEEALGGRELAYQEILLARLDLPPKQGYIEEIGSDYWWRHLGD